MEYSPEVLRRFQNPAHAGRIDGEDVVTGRAGRRRSGSDVVFYLRLAGDQISDARFEAYGCPHTIAAADYVAEGVVGKRTADAIQIDPHGIVRQLALPNDKIGQVLIVEDALRAALEKQTQTTQR